MADIVVSPCNEVYDQLKCEESIKQELFEYFSFKVPNWEHMKRKNKKLKYWKGDIHLFSKYTGRMYKGLRERLEQFAQDHSYEMVYSSPQADQEFSAFEASNFIKNLNLSRTPREYQFKAFLKAVRKKRLLVLSPTASGKSLIIYMLIRYFLKISPWYHGDGGWSGKKSFGPTKILLIVPTINLVHQMFSDFQEYGWQDIENFVHLIYEGQEKTSNKQIHISTWQSIYAEEKSFWNYDIIMVDEAHTAKAKSIKTIMEASTHTQFRYGFTGTLDDSLCHRLILEGLFGAVYQATTTRKLMDDNHVSQLKIKTILLKYSLDVCKMGSKMSYDEEMDFLVQHEGRNKFLKNLTLSLPQNTLLLYRYVDKHGKILFNDLQHQTNRPVYLIYGGTDGEDREKIRKIISTTPEQNAILVGSYGTVSTGIDIPPLHNILFGSPYKSRIRVLQSIGRGLRLAENKHEMIVFDIADDLSYKGKQNYTLEHFIERIRIYNEEDFKYKNYVVELK